MKKIGKLAILAGGDALPTLLAEFCQSKNIPFITIAFKGQPQPATVGATPLVFPLGALNKVAKTLKNQQVTHVVMAGRLNKVSVFDLRPDFAAMKLLASLKNKNDNTLLDALSHWFKQQGFEMVGAHEILPDLLVKKQSYTHTTPTDKKTIELGMNAAHTLGALDIGQAAIVKDGTVLGVEGVEGTNALIERCAALRGKNKGGVLVKCAKPQQNLKVDMPTIGPQTIELLAQYGYEGVAVEAGKSMLVDAENTIALANKNKVFIYGS